MPNEGFESVFEECDKGIEVEGERSFLEENFVAKMNHGN